MKLKSKGCNVYLLEDEKVYLVDSGTDADLIIKQVPELDGIIITHAHFDHFAAAYKIQKHFGCPVYVHPEDKPFILGEKEFLYKGFLGFIAKAFERFIKVRPPEDVKNILDLNLNTVHTPGHTPGSICILKDKNLFCGDLFRGNKELKLSMRNFCYDYDHYINSVKNILNFDFKLVLPGHGKVAERGKVENLLKRYNIEINSKK